MLAIWQKPGLSSTFSNASNSALPLGNAENARNHNTIQNNKTYCLSIFLQYFNLFMCEYWKSQKMTHAGGGILKESSNSASFALFPKLCGRIEKWAKFIDLWKVYNFGRRIWIVIEIFSLIAVAIFHSSVSFLYLVWILIFWPGCIDCRNWTRCSKFSVLISSLGRSTNDIVVSSWRRASSILYVIRKHRTNTTTQGCKTLDSCLHGQSFLCKKSANRMSPYGFEQRKRNLVWPQDDMIFSQLPA